MKRMLLLLIICASFLYAMPAAAILEEDMYGSDTEFGVDYGEPSHHDSSGMPDYQGDLAFLLIPAAIGFGYLLAIFQGWEAISKGVIGCIGCVVYLIFSTCIGKYDGTLQDILALLCIGGAIYLFHKRRKAKG